MYMYVEVLGFRYEVELHLFSGGEVIVRLPKSLRLVLELARDYGHQVIVSADARDSTMLMQALSTVDAVMNMGVPPDQVVLQLPYLPYARQDRVCNAGEPHSLRMLGLMLHALGVRKVVTYDVHSPAAFKYVTGITSIDKRTLLAYSSYGTNMVEKADALVSPDKGAYQSVFDVAQHFDKPLIKFEKVRDPESGSITSMRLVEGSVHVGGKHLLILDDICDGGRTFLELAKLLTDVGSKDYERPASLSLYTTHGIYSHGIDELMKFYTSIYTFNNINNVTGVKYI